MPEEKSFKPKFGRIRDRGGKAPKPTVAVIARSIERAGQGVGRLPTSGSTFTGPRIGRGIAHGTQAAQLNRFGGRRRVVVKIRIARFRGGDIGAARAHLRYVRRDGATREQAIAVRQFNPTTKSSLEHDQLLPEGGILGFKRAGRLEQRGQQPEDKEQQGRHSRAS